MNKRFKIVYYVLITLFALIFSYQIYLLVNVIMNKPHYEIGTMAYDE